METYNDQQSFLIKLIFEWMLFVLKPNLIPYLTPIYIYEMDNFIDEIVVR